MTKQQLDAIYEKLSLSLYKDFSFLFEDKSKLKKAIYMELDSILDKIDDVKVLEKYILKESKKAIYENFKYQISKGNFNMIFERYLEMNLSKDILNILIKFSKHLNNINYTPSFEEFNFVLDKIDNLIKPVIETNLNNIKHQNYNFVGNAIFLVSLFDTYCTINGLVEEECEDIDEIEKIKDKDEFYNKDDNKKDNSFYSDDSVKAFLREIREFPLLSIEEEKKLLLEYSKGSKEAFDTLIMSNMRLVASIAKRHSNRGLDFLDLVQEGSFGLMKAIERFDISRGLKFSTYATWWIKQAITRAICDKSRAVRLPTYMYERIYKVEVAKENFQNEYGRTPTVKELSNILNLSENVVSNIIKNNSDVVSLNALVGEGDTELGQFMPDENVNVEEQVISDSFKNSVRKALECSGLDSRSCLILKYRFGLIDGKVRTLIEIGKMLGVTNERIRQIEAKALKKLEHSIHFKKLKSYIDDKPDERLILEETKQEALQKNTISDNNREIVDLILNDCDLNKMELNVISYRFALKEGMVKPYSSEEIAALYRISYSRVVKLIKKALKKIELSVPLSDLKDSNDPGLISLYIKITGDNFLEEKKPVENKYVEVKEKNFNDNKIKEEKKSEKPIKVEVKEMRKSRKNIYVYYEAEGYTEQEIDAVLETLSKTEVLALSKRYGIDFKNPEDNKLSPKERTAFQNAFIKVGNKLARNKNITTPKSFENNKDTASDISNEKELIEVEEIENIVERTTTEAKEQNLLLNNQDLKTIQNKTTEITKEDCLNILEIFNTPEFKKLTMYKNDMLECFVIALVCGHIEGKFYSPLAIANFLQIDIERVNEIMSKGLLEFKDILNSKIDDAIENLKTLDTPFVKTIGVMSSTKND